MYITIYTDMHRFISRLPGLLGRVADFLKRKLNKTIIAIRGDESIYQK